MTFPARLTELIEKAYAEEWGMHSPLSVYLLKHAEAIRDLVVAASMLSRALDTGHRNNDGTQMGVRNPEKCHVDALREALAKLEEA